MADTKSILTTPIFNNNLIALQILGICSALAGYHKCCKRFGHVYRINLSYSIFKFLYLHYP